MEALCWLQRLTAYVDKDSQTSVVVERKLQLNGIKTQRYVRVREKNCHYIFSSLFEVSALLTAEKIAASSEQTY